MQHTTEVKWATNAVDFNGKSCYFSALVAPKQKVK